MYTVTSIHGLHLGTFTDIADAMSNDDGWTISDHNGVLFTRLSLDYKDKQWIPTPQLNILRESIVQHYLDNDYKEIHDKTFYGNVLRNPTDTIELILRNPTPDTLSLTIRTPALPNEPQTKFYHDQGKIPGLWDYGANVATERIYDLNDPNSITELFKVVELANTYQHALARSNNPHIPEAKDYVDSVLQ